MKKNVLFAAAVLAAVTLLPGHPSQAQAPARAQRGGGMKKMEATLGLTDAQKAQMKTIGQNARTQMKALRTPGTPPSADTRAKMQAIRKTAREQMMAVLTPAQKQQLMQQMKQMRQQRKDK